MGKRRGATPEPLAQLLAAELPLYLVDAQRRITFANSALAAWVGLPLEQIAGAKLAYHSQCDQPHAALLGLCPPPGAGHQGRVRGIVSNVDRQGHLVHRGAEFVPLAAAVDQQDIPLLVVVDPRDMTAVEMAQQVAGADRDTQWHAQLAQWRLEQSRSRHTDVLLGNSRASLRARQQAIASVRSRVATLVVADTASEAEHVARAIHEGGEGSPARRQPRTLLVVNGPLAALDDVRTTLATARRQTTPTTLLVPQIVELSRDGLDELLANAGTLPACVQLLATHAGSRDELTPEIAALLAIEVSIPALRSRSTDLPLLAQAIIERCNAAHAHQVRGLAAPALDILGLYAWPGGCDELDRLLSQAHANCQGSLIEPEHLPAVLHHAVQQAALPDHRAESLDVDQVVNDVQRWLVERALALSTGRKAEAARLLGISRPRLYRLMESAGLIATEDTAPAAEDEA